MIKKYILPLFIITSLSAQPKLTVVLILDSFAAYQIDKLNKHLHYGIRTFLDKGTCFQNATYPHGNPVTACGHACLSTGTLPKDHGIISGNWFKNGKKIEVKNTAPDCLLQPTINDIFIKQNKNNHALALSIKNYAALLTAGKQTPAIWFDQKKNLFKGHNLTPEAQKTIHTINKRATKLMQHPLVWQPAYQDGTPYKFPHINNYHHAFTETFIDKTIKKTDPDFSSVFIRSPITNKLLFDAAFIYLKNVLKEQPHQILLWISLSSLDQVTHFFGPQSKETIDTIYHLDHYLEDFMHHIETIIEPQNILYVLTADHGFIPIPELNYPKGKSFLAPTVKKNINQKLEAKHGLKNIIKDLRTPFIYIDHERLTECNNVLEQSILEDIKTLLEEHPAIAKVYKSIELIKNDYKIGSKKWLFKNLIHPTRSGTFIFKVAANTLLQNEKNKTVHNTPYSENLHVPLIFYQPHKNTAQQIEVPVWMPQLTATLASILNVSRINPTSLPPLPLNIKDYKI